MDFDASAMYDVGAMEAPSTSAATTLTTNRQGRAVLGVASTYLKRGYEAVAKMPRGPFYAGVKTQKSAQDLLDRTRKFAETTYRNLPNNDEPISANNRKKVALALKQASSNLQLVSSVTAEMSRSLIQDAGRAIAATARRSVSNFRQSVTEAVKGGGGWLGKLAIAGVIGGAGYMIYKLWPRKTEGRVLDSNQNNPPTWVHPADIGKWERSVDAVKPDWGHHANPYAVVTHVYKNMGGRVVAAPGTRQLEAAE